MKSEYYKANLLLRLWVEISIGRHTTFEEATAAAKMVVNKDARELALGRSEYVEGNITLLSVNCDDAYRKIDL